MRVFSLLVIALTTTVGISVVDAAEPPSSVPVSATSLDVLDIDFDPLGTNGILGVEFNAPSALQFMTYGEMLRWDSDGDWLTFDTDRNSPTYFLPNGGVAGPRVESAATWVRLEGYPSVSTDCVGDDPLDACYLAEGYSPFDTRHGGFHIQLERSAGEPWPAIGRMTPPVPGDVNGGFFSQGDIVSSRPITDARLQIDGFQIDCSPHEECISPPRTTTGVTYGAFGTGRNRGDQWAIGVIWPGRYMIYAEDRDTNVKVQGIVDVGDDGLPTLDLDAPCFGMPTCVTVDGFSEPQPAASSFHPMAPVRILDTRSSVGIDSGPVRPGDGRLDDPNPWNRLDEVHNHELTVTGVGGIPESGVSAVLLNVTAVDPSADGFITVGPRPAGTGNVFDDQNTFGEWPSASNLNLRAGVTTPNMVLVRVGAGGRIRLHVYGATTHVLADVAGWFTSADDGNAGFTPLRPERILDTRKEETGALPAGETRRLRVAGIAGVPADAESVVVNLTAVAPSGDGFVTVFPSGAAVPDVSNLNLRGGVTRPNMAVVAIGADGSIDIRPELAATHVLVDVFGYYKSGTGRPTTTADPFRIGDTRNGIGTERAPFTSGETRRFRVAGVGAVPADATAVYVNLTIVSPTGEGFLTAWPSGGSSPDVSNLNWSAGEIIPNMAVVGLGDDGSIDVRVDLPWAPDGTAEVLVDVLGWTS